MSDEKLLNLPRGMFENGRFPEELITPVKHDENDLYFTGKQSYDILCFLLDRIEEEGDMDFMLKVTANFSRMNKKEKEFNFDEKKSASAKEQLKNYFRNYCKELFMPEEETNQKIVKSFEENTEQSTIPKRNKSRQEGVIYDLPKKIANITDKDLPHALIPLANTRAYIQQLDKNFFNTLEFDEENGVMRIKGSLDNITLQNWQTRSNIKELDLPALRLLYTVIYENAVNIDNHTITVYMPKLAEALGIYVRDRADKNKASDLMRKIRAFEHVIGVLNNGSFFRLLVFMDYDKEKNTILFGSPYINRIIRELIAKNTIQEKGKKIKGGKVKPLPYHSYLVHTDIAKERNKIAVEIVYVIERLLAQRGEVKEPKETLTKKQLEKSIERGVKKALKEEFGESENLTEYKKEIPIITTAHKSFIGIINEIPLFKEALDGIEQTKDKNNLLKRHFKKAYELLKEKTDLYKHYENLTIPEIIPTVSVLDNTLKITHTGKIKK